MTAEQLLQLLRGEVGSLTRGHPEVAVAYSGGLDSSIVAVLASESASVRTYACAVSESHDARNAEESARNQKLAFQLLLLDDEDLVSLLKETAGFLPSENPAKIAYSIPTCFVMKKSSEETILTGSGADELFGGYAKYATASDPEALMEADLRKALEENAALSRFASDNGKQLRSPFLSDEVISFARSMSLDDKIQGGRRKVALREVARTLGLRAYDTPKKAAQYSSGTLGRMRRLAKSDGLSLSEWVAKTRGE